jgi:hypothetical protein
MSDQEDTLRSPKHYHQDEKKQVKQHGGEELASKPNGKDARANPKEQQENRERMGVNEEHKTKKMRKEHRGTYP